MITWRRPKDSHLQSSDGRFHIIPIYRSTVRPDGYWLEDRSKKIDRRFGRSTCFSVKEAKDLAEQILRNKNNPPKDPLITEDML